MSLLRSDYSGLSSGLPKATDEESEAMLRRIAEIVFSQGEPGNRLRLCMVSFHEDDGWVFNTTGQQSAEAEIKCGTAHCIAGWAQVLGPKEYRALHAEQAGDLLVPTAAHMFYVDDWEALAFLRTKLADPESVEKIAVDDDDGDS